MISEKIQPDELYFIEQYGGCPVLYLGQINKNSGRIHLAAFKSNSHLQVLGFSDYFFQDDCFLVPLNVSDQAISDSERKKISSRLEKALRESHQQL